MVDLIIAGGGPTGLAAAIEARQHGLSVVLVEPRQGDIDKACGEGLMPRAVDALMRLGVALPDGVPFAGIRYREGATAAAARFSLGPGLGVRRTTLHRAMRERASQLGVQRVAGRITSWTEGPDWIEAAGTRARWLIAADGLQSGIRQKLELELPPRMPPRVGARQHFRTAPYSDFVEVHWHPRAEAYVTPVASDTVGVGILFYPDAVPPGPGTPFDRLLRLFPEVAERMGPPCSKVAGAGPFEQSLRAHHSGRILLVGDAAGFVDPMTGEGIRLGLETAEAAIAAVRAEDPVAYERAWRRITRRYRWVTGLLLQIRSRPSLRRHLVPTVARWPRLLRWALDFLNGP